MRKAVLAALVLVSSCAAHRDRVRIVVEYSSSHLTMPLPACAPQLISVPTTGGPILVPVLICPDAGPPKK